MSQPVAFKTAEGESVVLNDPALIVVGFSARDEEQVSLHIRELEEHGIAPPQEIPAAWKLPNPLLQTGNSITVNGRNTSGEVEPVLILSRAGRFLAVGSDHTDRDLEKESMQAAKAACPKIVSSRCWPLEPLMPLWDDLELSSEIRKKGSWLNYQRDRLKTLRPLDWFLERFEGKRETVVFMGTVPLTNGLDFAADAFYGQLLHPEGGRLQVHYEVIKQR